MSIIYKYPIEFEFDFGNTEMYVNLPENSEVFSVIFTDIYTAYIYAIVHSTEGEKEKRDILWLGTGQELTKEQEDKIKYYTFLGTFKISDLVWHLWIEPEKEKWTCIDFDTNTFYEDTCYKVKR